MELPELPPPIDWCTDQADHRHDTFTAPQMQEYARQAVLADRDARQSEAEQVCAEAYQAKMIHNDVLPWESAAAIREGK
jgi:hypothetical protein